MVVARPSWRPSVAATAYPVAPPQALMMRGTHPAPPRENEYPSLAAVSNKTGAGNLTKRGLYKSLANINLYCKFSKVES